MALISYCSPPKHPNLPPRKEELQERWQRNGFCSELKTKCKRVSSILSLYLHPFLCLQFLFILRHLFCTPGCKSWPLDFTVSRTLHINCTWRIYMLFPSSVIRFAGLVKGGKEQKKFLPSSRTEINEQFQVYGRGGERRKGKRNWRLVETILSLICFTR